MARKSRTGGASTESMSATDAQNNFGRVLKKAAAGGVVFITRYDQPEAVVMSAEKYRSLQARELPDLTGLAAEFDELVEQMQGAGQSAAVDDLFAFGATSTRRARAQHKRRA